MTWFDAIEFCNKLSEADGRTPYYRLTGISRSSDQSIEKATVTVTRDRLTLLQQANLDLELLRFQFRAVKDLKCLSIDSYGSASRFVNEIGKLVGGWLRQVSGGHHAASQQSVAGTDELPQSAAGRPQGRSRQTPTP